MTESTLAMHINEGLAELDCTDSVCASLARSENQARRQAKNVDPPRADQRIVEVVEVETGGLFGARRGRVGEAKRACPVRAEVLDVRVADHPTLPRACLLYTSHVGDQVL